MTSIPIFTGNLFVGNLFTGGLFFADPGPVPASIGLQLRVPRVPIRLQRNDQQGPEKIDPRSVRFTETLMTIINGLLRNARIVRIGVDDWIIPVFPRETSDANAFNGEIFFSTDDLVLKYKMPGGAVITLGGGGSGTVTAFSFTDANGFTGVVTNPTTTPDLTLTLDEIDGGGP